VLSELALRAAAITGGSLTRLLVNDRADIAYAAGADGVHLTAQSLPAAVVRQTFGADFLIGVSTHSFAEVRAALEGGADLAVFGPVFETTSKRIYGAPVGLEKLKEAAHKLAPFPILALGGITLNNAMNCIAAGASGIAAIGLFSDPENLATVVETVARSSRVDEQP